MAREYRRRTLPGASLERLLCGLERLNPKPELVNLQLGEDRLLASSWDGRWAGELSEAADFAATADLIGQLDLVISVDTASAHLLGAIGAPGWILLPWSADPRWLRQRHDSPWYPNLKLWRQPRHRDWDGLVEQVISGLAIWLRR
jgi:ADP-heptose:LPS heptosyltransferase